MIRASAASALLRRRTPAASSSAADGVSSSTFGSALLGGRAESNGDKDLLPFFSRRRFSFVGGGRSFLSNASLTPMAPLSGRNDDDDDDSGGCSGLNRASCRSVSSLSESYRIRRHDLSALNPPRSFGRFDSRSVRSYHTTPRREILPLVALVVVGVTVRYSYKALVRMDEEWEEYEEALREYKANNPGYVAETDDDDDDAVEGGADGAGSSAAEGGVGNVARSFKDGVMGIDLGTVNLRLSHVEASSIGAGGRNPAVVVDREGGRSTPAAVYFDDDEAVWGRLAAAKVHERGDVRSPHRILMEGDEKEGGGGASRAVAEVVRPACRNALDQVLSSSGGAAGSSLPSPLFSVTGGIAGSYNVRPTFSYPPVEDGNTGEWDAGYVSRYAAAVSELTYPESVAKFVPEPVAAVSGARKFGVLPPASSSAGGGKAAVLVIDVGGTATSTSLVAPSVSDDAKHEGEYDVVECLRLPGLGGESLVEAAANHVARGFFEGVKSASDVKDGMALQRLYDAARGAIMEVSGGKSRVQLNVPYLTVDDKMRPRHLDAGMSADVLEEEVNDLVRSRAEEYGRAGVLSKSFPPPKDLSSAFGALVMRVLEEGDTNPFELENVLVVGGGARSPIVQRALRRGLASVAGEQFADEKVVVPRGELIEELVVLGLAVEGGKS